MPTNLRPSQFISEVSRQGATALHAAGFPFNKQARSRLVKFWEGEEAADHYEVWLHERTSQLELGLHLESDAVRNAALYRGFDRCLLDIQLALGGRMWLEEWDHGWVRLYETEPLWPLDTARAEAVTARLVEIVTVVQPVYRALLEAAA